MAIRFGMIGTNFISDSFIDALSKTDNTVSCVFSRTAEKGYAFAEKHGIGKVYCDFDEFLSSDFDAVYVATPNSVHKSQSIAALTAGKHVLCEKPAASNAAEFAEMVEASKKSGRILLEAMRPVFDPATDIIKENLHKLGTIRRAVIDFSQYSSRYDRFKNGERMNTFDTSLSNAAVMDIGVYCIAVCEYLFGQPTKIMSDSVFLDGGFEGAGTAVFKYDGFDAEIRYSKISDTYLPNYIEGENGTLIFTKTSLPHDISIHYRDGSTETIDAPVVKNNMIYEINEFVMLIEAGRTEHKYNEYTMAVMRTIDTVRRQNGIVFPADLPR